MKIYGKYLPVKSASRNSSLRVIPPEPTHNYSSTLEDRQWLEDVSKSCGTPSGCMVVGGGFLGVLLALNPQLPTIMPSASGNE